MTYFLAAVLGIVQGVTEFLPISSTAHLLIGESLLRFNDPNGVFAVMIQLGSILAVVWLYRAKLLAVLAGLHRDAAARRFACVMLTAFLPAAVVGAVFGDYVQQVLYDSPRIIAAAFVAGGIVILIVERFRPAVVVPLAELTPISRAFGIGLCQTLALVPGVSRSGATIMGGMLMGLDRAAAAEFSFFLAIPTMAGAFAKNLYDVRHQLVPERAGEIAIGLATAFLASVFVIRPFLAVVRHSGFMPFAWYRIAVGIALFAALAAGWAGWSVVR